MTTTIDKNKFQPVDTLLGETMTIGILGAKRTGKTLLASKLCFDIWNRNEFYKNNFPDYKPMKIFHMGNLAFGQKIDDITILTEQDPEYLNNCLLFIDEAKTIFDNRASGSAFQRLLANNLIQAGHQGISIIWTTQNEHGLSYSIKAQTDIIIDILPQSGKSNWVKDDYVNKHDKFIKSNLCDGFTNGTFKEHHQEKKYLVNENGDKFQVSADCRETKKRHNIFYDITFQSQTRQAGKQLAKAELCAQRYYGLSDTTFKVSASDSMFITSDDFRKKRELDIVNQFEQLLVLLVKQEKKEATTLRQLQKLMAQYENFPDWDFRKIKSTLKGFGIKEYPAQSGRFPIVDYVNTL